MSITLYVHLVHISQFKLKCVASKILIAAKGLLRTAFHLILIGGIG